MPRVGQRIWPSDEAPVATEIGPRETVRLSVLTSGGRETTLTIDENTEVVVVATWCPYTHQLDDILNDPRTSVYLQGKKLVYLFGYDELDRKVAEWVRGGRASQAEADAFLATQSRGPRLFDREFLEGVAAEQVYFYNADHPLRHDYFPAAFSGAPNEFLMDRFDWLHERLGMPREQSRAIGAMYPVEGAASSKDGSTNPA